MKDEKKKPYVHQDYPRMLYRNSQTCIVADPEGQAAKEQEGWGESPHTTHVIGAPVALPAPEPVGEPGGEPVAQPPQE